MPCQGLRRSPGLVYLVLLAGCAYNSHNVDKAPPGKGEDSSILRRCKDCRTWISSPAEQGNILRTNRTGLHIGYAPEGSSTTSSLRFTVGVEQWENGQRTDHRYQVWRFDCSSGGLLRSGHWCSIERLVIDDWGQTLPDPVVTAHEHSPSDSTLKINRLDWVAGVLDLSLVLDDGETIETEIRFERNRNNYNLLSFKAYTIHRSTLDKGELSTIEYRIPSYTYILNVPLEMKGMSDAGLEKWDSLFDSLSAADQQEWWNFVSTRNESDQEWKSIEKELREKLRVRLPGVSIDTIEKGVGKLTKDQELVVDQTVKELTTRSLINKIEATKLSAEAKQRIELHVKNGLLVR